MEWSMLVVVVKGGRAGWENTRKGEAMMTSMLADIAQGMAAQP
jgi:hypothetical protein